MSHYQVILKDVFGNNPVFFTRVHHLRCGRSDRFAYSLTLKIPSEDYDYRLLEEWMIIEVYRNDGYAVQKIDGEACFFVRDWDLQLDEEGKELLVMYAYDPLSLLDGRINAYYSKHSFASYSTYARNALVLTVQRNMGTAVADAAREIDSGYFTTEDAVMSGETIKKTCAWQDIKSLLDNIVDQSRGLGSWITYDIVYRGAFPLVFTTFAGQRGIDRGTKVTLSPEGGNLATPKLAFRRQQQITHSYLLGAGEGSERLVGTATLANISRSPFARVEAKKENTQVEDQDVADAEAEELINKYKGRVYLSGNIVQTEGTTYGIDWGYGDLLRAKWKGIPFQCRVSSYEIFYSNANGEITDHTNAQVEGESWL